jgi:hypothetical protein
MDALSSKGACAVMLLALSLLPGGRSGREVAPTNVAADPLLGKWVRDGHQDAQEHLEFQPAGRAVIRTEGQKPQRYFYMRESIRDWTHRRVAELRQSGSNEPKEFPDPAKEMFGPNAQVISLRGESTGGSRYDDGVLFFYPQAQILTIPFEAVYVRLGTEKRYSKRVDRGDGSLAPFKFLAGITPIFADEATGDWAYTFRGDWRSFLPKAAAEVRAVGFDGPPVEEEAAGLRGETGSVFYYRTMDSEKVIFVPNFRQTWDHGNWGGRETKGWITVHVNIKTTTQLGRSPQM